MPRISKASFACVTTQGGIFPAEFLARVATGDGKGAPEGLAPADYHLPGSERLSEAVNRSWNLLKGRWEDFKNRAGQLAKSDYGTGLTRENWLLPLFQELGFGRLQGPPQKIEIEGREYPVSHMWGGVPIHLLGIGLEIDHRTPGAAGAARMSPHAMLQEYLNRSETALWGIVTNGRTLRLLRDNAALTRQAYVEFDLQAIFDGSHFSDFSLLWLLCHQSRFEGERPELGWLEKWTQEARKQGVRLLEHLRDGVEKSIEALGTGFLAHLANQSLRDRLHSGQLGTQDYYRQVLRLVYRLIFLFVAEDRDLLLLPSAPAAARDRYRRFYSTRRIRDLALRRAGTAHGDLWEMLSLVLCALGSDDGCPALALPALGSFLWSDAAMPDLADMKLANRHLLDALRCLATMRSQEEKVRRVVDYRNLGAEELGSVYESLLELHPQINLSARAFALSTAAGNERKTSGSYYTPDSLVQCLLDSALDPVMDEAVKGRKGEAAADAILALKVCDPAVGSGHFLIAAAHRMARRVAAARSGEDEPAPGAIHTALRQVIGRCLYGVDINPMSAELCKVSLWMEAMEPGKPLSFLDHHIQCGNSLLGATPGLMARGIPDEAFEPIEGDDKKVCSGLKKRNRQERGGQMDMLHLMSGTAPAPSAALTQEFEDLETLGGTSLQEVRLKQDRYSSLVDSPTYRNARLAADTWCAAFVWRKDGTDPAPITSDAFKRLQADPSQVAKSQRDEIDRLAAQYRFFHWHLAFPGVFQPLETIDPKDSNGWKGGFDLVLGNPPWERVKLQEKEWFAERVPEIANAPTAAARKHRIEQLENESPTVYCAFRDDVRKADGEGHLLRNSGRFPLCGRGDINLYAVFAESMRAVLCPNGHMGAVVPSGIATDDTTKLYFQDLVESQSLVSLYSFENEEFLFPGVHHAMKFCLLTAASALAEQPSAQFVFYARQADHVHDLERRFSLSAAEITALSPNTKTCPVFRRRRDAEVCLQIYRRLPVLWAEGDKNGNVWNIEFGRMFDMANDSKLFRSHDELVHEGGLRSGNRYLASSGHFCPLYEAKMVDAFDHRAASVVLNADAIMRQGVPDALSEEAHRDPNCLPLPRYWVSQADVEIALCGRRDSGLLGFCDVTAATNERTMIAAILPRVAVGHTLPVAFLGHSESDKACLLACLNSHVFDYVGRQKIGGIHYTYFILKQIPVLPPAAYAARCAWGGSEATILREWLLSRIIELSYTAWDLQSFAQHCGWSGPPFRWDVERRFLLRCELDAAFFHLYGLDGDDSAYIMDSFPIVKRKDEAKYGNYRTKDAILEIYDAMQRAMVTGHAYETRLDPTPAAPSCRHPKLGLGILAYGSLIGDPGAGIASKIKLLLKTQTPFPVEYGRLSQSRGGAPTLVPHERGARVNAEILVLDDSVTFEKARDLLWCRERHKVGSGETYREGTGADCVLVREWNAHPCVERLLYADFNPSGKDAPADAVQLATAAVASVGRAKLNEDGITYLKNAISAGISTPLTDAYVTAILRATGTESLDAALKAARASNVM